MMSAGKGQAEALATRVMNDNRVVCMYLSTNLAVTDSVNSFGSSWQ